MLYLKQCLKHQEKVRWHSPIRTVQVALDPIFRGDSKLKREISCNNCYTQNMFKTPKADQVMFFNQDHSSYFWTYLWEDSTSEEENVIFSPQQYLYPKHVWSARSRSDNILWLGLFKLLLNPFSEEILKRKRKIWYSHCRNCYT